MSKQTFRREIETVINRHSKENGSNTPDFILAEYLTDCLKAFDKAVKYRDNWYGNKPTFVEEPKLFDGIKFPDEKPGYPSKRNAELP